MSERFYLATPPRDGRVLLTGDEARHLARVMQCGRDRLMDIAEPASVAALVKAAGPGATIVIADRDGGGFEAATPAGRPLVGLIGPEGGFTAEELAVAVAAGGRRISLGAHVLRVETAAVALAARLA